MTSLNYEEVIAKYAEMEGEELQNIAELLAHERMRDNSKIVVLDDDPTGIQAVHDVCVYTDWTQESIAKGLLREEKLFFILTNSRAMSAEETTAVHREIAERIISLAGRLNRKVIVISRGDSTLRGHFPLETSLLREELECGGRTVDGEIIIPFFEAGGRVTVDNVHYVRQGKELVPAGETEFAGDKTFGYSNSNLPKYIEEKTGGTYPAENVLCISLEDLRKGRVEKITQLLMGLTDFQKVIVNALSEQDLRVFCLALYRAINAGKYFLYRTAADFVKVFGGITPRGLLAREEMLSGESRRGGVVVAGSHTARTTSQLEALRELSGLIFMEFHSDLVLSGELEAEVDRVVEKMEKAIQNGQTAVVYTTRRLLTCENDTKEEALARSVKISEAVSNLVGHLRVKPSFIVAKGGITSSDIGVKALSVKEAYVLGQIQPGIPVWKTDADSKFPEIPYVIFPGNVGEADSLRKVVEILR